jgi:hypothetical protein
MFIELSIIIFLSTLTGHTCSTLPELLKDLPPSLQDEVYLKVVRISKI